MMTRDELEDMAWDEPHVAAEWIIKLREALEAIRNQGSWVGGEWLASSEAEELADAALEATEDNQ